MKGNEYDNVKYNELRLSNYYGVSLIGLSFAFSALLVIPILFLLSLFIKSVLRYNMYTLGIFLVLTILIKLLLDGYIFGAPEHYFSYFFFLDEFKDDLSAKGDYVMGIIILIATLISAIALGNFCTLLEFGIMLSFVFFGLSMASAGAQVEETPLEPLPFKHSSQTQNIEIRTYKWRYNSMDITKEDTFSIIAHINKKVLECARSKPRIKLYRDDDIYKWAVYPEAITEEVKEVALKLREISQKKGFYRIEEMTNTLSLVQQAIPYSYDRDTAPHHEEDYPRYPVETLYDKTGDCECKTFLACSLLLALGYDVAYFYLGSPVDHIALGIASNPFVKGYFVPYKGKRYYYYETTAEGWRFGQIPPKWKGYIKAVVPIHRKEVNDLSHCEGKSSTAQKVGNEISKDTNIDEKEESK